MLWDLPRLDLVPSIPFLSLCSALESFLEEEFRADLAPLEPRASFQGSAPPSQRDHNAPKSLGLGLSPGSAPKMEGERPFWHFGRVRLNRKMLPPWQSCFLKLLLKAHHINPAQAELVPSISSS